MSNHLPTTPHLNPHERGQGLVEYALILTLVAVAVIGVLSVVGPGVGNVFSNVLSGLQVAAQEQPASSQPPTPPPAPTQPPTLCQRNTRPGLWEVFSRASNGTLTYIGGEFSDPGHPTC